MKYVLLNKYHRNVKTTFTVRTEQYYFTYCGSTTLPSSHEMMRLTCFNKIVTRQMYGLVIGIQ